MSRCLAKLLCSILFLGLVAGCTRQCYFVKGDLDAAVLPPAAQNLETEPFVAKPVVPSVPKPATVTDSDRPARYLTLQEAIASALENGVVSAQGLQNGQGIVSTNLVGFTGGPLASQSDSIRVLSYNPAMAYAGIEQSLSRFDAQFVSSLTNAYTDELASPANPLTENGTVSSFNSTVVKALPSGGVISTTFGSDYQNLIQPGSGQINPLWKTFVQFGYEQPLIRDYGEDINQVLNRVAPVLGAAMPTFAATAYNNKLTPLNQSSSLAGGGAVFTEGILIARIRFDSQRAEFERNVNNLVINAEVAYWNLYEAYGELYSYEELLRLSHKVWMIYYEKYTAGAQEGSMKNYAPILAKYWELKGSRLAALGKVLDAERNLRGIIGMPVEDGNRLVPITPPTMAMSRPDWDSILRDSMALKPELFLARENVRLAQLNLINQKNFLKPDLRFFATYQPVGFGTGLLPTGSGQMFNGNGNPISNGSLDELAGNHFNDWQAGLIFNVPIGYRLEHAAVRQARLNVAQAYDLLRDQEARVQRHAEEQFQKVAEWHQRIAAATAERKAYGAALQAYVDEIRVGRLVPSSDLLVISGQLSQAMVKQFDTIAEYNNSLARLEWAKGSLLQYNNVTIAERPLPGCVEERATQHLQEMTKSILLLQHPAANPFALPGRLVGDRDGNGPPQPLVNDAAEKQSNSSRLSPDEAWNRQTKGDPDPSQITLTPPQLPSDQSQPVSAPEQAAPIPAPANWQPSPQVTNPFTPLRPSGQ